MALMLMAVPVMAEHTIKDNYALFGDNISQSIKTIKLEYGDYNPRIIIGISYFMEQFRDDRPTHFWNVGVKEVGHTYPKYFMDFDKGSFELPYRNIVAKSYGDYDNGLAQIERKEIGNSDTWRLTFNYPLTKGITPTKEYTVNPTGKACKMDIDYMGHQTASLKIMAYDTIKTPYYVEGEVSYKLFNKRNKLIGEWDNFNSLREDIKTVGIPLECFFVDVQVDIMRG